MSAQTIRYVAEIEREEGYISVDCEILPGDDYVVSLILNQTSVEKTGYLEQNSSDFKKLLFNLSDLKLITKNKDIRSFLNALFREEFGVKAEIQIREVDFD